MADYATGDYPAQASGGTEDHSIHTEKTLGARIDNANDDINMMSIHQDPEMIGALVDTGIMKRHQGMYSPGKYPEHYGTPFK